jgi:acetyl-CoA carboxylase biotin carboxyl carrier protein
MRELFIRKLIKMVEQSDIDTLEVSSWGRTVRIQRSRSSTNGNSTTPVTAAPTTRVPAVEAPAAPAPAEPTAKAVPDTPPADLHEIKSPMVGTFYRAPSPDAKPYVDVGDRVTAGQVVCIVEAMKLMNEILSEVNGVVEAVLVDNAKPVEYGQAMFRIKKT